MNTQNNLKKGNYLAIIGILMFSIIMLINRRFGLPDNITDWIMGISIGFEIVGLFFILKEKHNK